MIVPYLPLSCVGGCVGGYLPRYPCNHPRYSCICRYNTKVNFTLSGFFLCLRVSENSVKVKILINSCYDNNQSIFFLKTVSLNVRRFQTMSDLFSLKVLVEMLREFGKCWGNGFKDKNNYLI